VRFHFEDSAANKENSYVRKQKRASSKKNSSKNLKNIVCGSFIENKGVK
jgi:hypothetical protein